MSSRKKPTDRDLEIEAARLRMLTAADRRDRSRVRDLWDEWQRAATDYWILLHPDLRPFRRGDRSETPTVDEMRAFAEAIARARDDIPQDWRLRPHSDAKVEHLARVGWFHELLDGLYAPVHDALRRLRAGDASGLETLVRFLEADVYCFRSGYTKADVLHRITTVDLDDATILRLRRVLLDAVDGHDRREFRKYVRLARRVDSPELRAALRDRVETTRWAPRRHAEWILTALGEGPDRQQSGS